MSFWRSHSNSSASVLSEKFTSSIRSVFSSPARRATQQYWASWEAAQQSWRPKGARIDSGYSSDGALESRPERNMRPASIHVRDAASMVEVFSAGRSVRWSPFFGCTSIVFGLTFSAGIL